MDKLMNCRSPLLDEIKANITYFFVKYAIYITVLS